jgi:acyl carrier protein
MNIEVPEPDTDLMENGYLDSLSFVRMLTLLEDEFDIQISMDELDFEFFKTIDGVTNFVQQKLEGED